MIKITDVNGISKENSMNRIKTHLSIILTATLLGVLNPGDAYGTSPVDWVDPLIDTHASRWFYFNSASRPFGMVNLSPDTQTKGSWESGYLYGDKKIRCFSHIYAWQLSGIPVMPIAGEMMGHQGMDVYQSEFSHEDESVQWAHAARDGNARRSIEAKWIYHRALRQVAHGD